MKTIIISSLFLSCLLALGDAPAPSTNSTAASSPQASEKARAFEIRDLLVAVSKSGDTTQASWDAITTKIDNYQKEFGVSTATTNNVILLRKYELSVAKKFADPARYNALLQQLATDPLPAVAEMASQQIAVQKRLEDLKTKPIDLQFTALDGTSVDLAKMRGKVVLIDFWASWCPDCVTEAPGVVDAYKKYHDQGFEIVGVSLDEDKAALLAFAQQTGMVWPQYFDGKKWNNDVSKSFDISSIPAMWLVDKKGLLVTKNGRDNLAGQVESLLKTP
jgi:thiol-disulfide isomerase/thioredoxin